MFGNMLKRARSSSNSTDLDLLAGIPTTIGELEGKDGDKYSKQLVGYAAWASYHLYLRTTIIYNINLKAES